MLCFLLSFSGKNLVPKPKNEAEEDERAGKTGDLQFGAEIQREIIGTILDRGAGVPAYSL